MMTRRQVMAGLLGMGAGGALAGCGRVPEWDKQGRPILRYMAWGNPEQLAVEQQIAGEFEKRNPNVRVHLFLVPGSSYADKLQLMLASRTAPDVMRVDHYNFPSLARKEYFLPLDPLIAAEPKGFLDDFVAPALEECRWKGVMYGMNVLFGPVQLYYNRALFQEAGLPDPYKLDKADKWTWEAFTDAATRLTKRDASGRALQFGSTMPTFPQYASIIWNFGGEIMNRDITQMVLGNDAGAIRGMEAFADLRWKHHCAPTPADNALSAFTFESGKIGMHWGWSGESPRFRKNIKKFAWDICPTPSGPAGNATVVKGNQIVIYKDSPHPKEAWEFIKFMTGPEAEMLLGGQLRRCVPTRKSVQNDPRYLQSDKPPFQNDVFLECVRRGRTLPIDWRYQEWVTEYNGATEGLFNLGNETAEAACKAAQSRVNALLAGEEGF